jgi:hypothetical protein
VLSRGLALPSPSTEVFDSEEVNKDLASGRLSRHMRDRLSNYTTKSAWRKGFTPSLHVLLKRVSVFVLQRSGAKTSSLS